MSVEQMITVDVPVRFDGHVRVRVPADAPNPMVLAEKLALARILAATENVDAPDLEAFEEWLDTNEGLEEEKGDVFWDASQVDGVGGNWVTHPES